MKMMESQRENGVDGEEEHEHGGGSKMEKKQRNLG